VLHLQAFFTLARDIKLKMDKKLVRCLPKSIVLIVVVLNDAIWDEHRCKGFQLYFICTAFYSGLSLSFDSTVVLIFTLVANVLLYE